MTFADFEVNASCVEALTEQSIITPTPVQQEAIPKVLEGGDLRFGGTAGHLREEIPEALDERGLAHGRDSRIEGCEELPLVERGPYQEWDVRCVPALDRFDRRLRDQVAVHDRDEDHQRIEWHRCRERAIEEEEDQATNQHQWHRYDQHGQRGPGVTHQLGGGAGQRDRIATPFLPAGPDEVGARAGPANGDR